MVIWQDIVISIVNIVFSLALVPQVYYNFKNKVGSVVISASLPTFLGLYVLTFTFYTLNLYYSTIVSFMTGSFWLILFIQKLIYH